MPPRYAYWTILIDGKPTAFRARDREELLPTFNQLARKNTDIVMRYFARGRLWDTPEQAQWASRNRAETRGEPRNRDWRPGGEHKDPRARWSEKPKKPVSGPEAHRRGRADARFKDKEGWAGGAGRAGRGDARPDRPKRFGGPGRRPPRKPR